MNKRKINKKPLIVGLILMVIGAAIMAAVFGVCGFDGIFGGEAKKTEYQCIGDDISMLEISADESNIKIVRTGNEKCKVVYGEDDLLCHGISEENGKLKITVTDNRKWYDYIRPVLPDRYYITVYLPEKTECDINIETKSGEVECYGINAGDLCISAQSGDAEMENCKIAGSLTVKVKSGDVSVENSDASEAEIETQSGEVELGFITPKHYVLSSSSGRIDEELLSISDDNAGICRVVTRSGDIEMN